MQRQKLTRNNIVSVAERQTVVLILASCPVTGSSPREAWPLSYPYIPLNMPEFLHQNPLCLCQVDSVSGNNEQLD